MDTIVKSLSPSDIFLIETDAGTNYITASGVNYISEQFSKFFNKFQLNKLIVYETVVTTLSSNSFELLNNTATITTSGVFNTYNISNGVITSAYNTYDSQTSGFSAAADLGLSAVSASYYSVFFDSGSAIVDYYIYNNNVDVQRIVGTKTVPAGLTIGAEDIQFKATFNNSIDNIINSGGVDTSFVVTTSLPIVYMRDYDYALDYFDDEIETTSTFNNYISTNKVVFDLIVCNNPLNPPGGRLILFWKVQKFY